MKPAKEAKAKFETYLVTAEAKIKKSLIKFRVVLTQLIFFFKYFFIFTATLITNNTKR